MLIQNNIAANNLNPSFSAKLKIGSNYASQKLWRYVSDDINYYNASNNKANLHLIDRTFENFGQKLSELKRFYTDNPDVVVEFTASETTNGFQFKNLSTGQVVRGVYMGLVNKCSKHVLDTLASLNYNNAFWKDTSKSYLSDLVVNSKKCSTNLGDVTERRCKDYLVNTPEGWKIVPKGPHDELVNTPEGWKIKSGDQLIS